MGRLKQRILIGTSAAVLAAVAAGPALAQSAAVEACRDEETAEARIACLEAALLASEAEAEAAEAAAPAPEADEGRSWLRMPRLPGFGRGGDAEPAADAAPEVAAEGLGAEQVARRTRTRADDTRSEDDTRVAAQIVDFSTFGYRSLEVVLDNGQVWRQQEGDIQRIDLDEGDPMAVEIWRSRWGGYRMRLTEQKRILKVERIR